MPSFSLPNLPAQLTWHNAPVEWKVESGNLTILAGENTDWFTDPAGGYAKDNSPAAWFTPPEASFLLSAKVTVNFASAFDAGVLQIRAREGHSGKLCFEYSPQGQPMIVSVVTHGVSDDCNSVLIDGSTVYLRLAHTPQTTSFHYSLDGVYWHFVRYFALGTVEALKVGFSSQSPTGKLCQAVFSEIHYRPETLKDNRSGE